MIPAIIYNRVSTREQAEYGYSLETQANDNLNYANKNGFIIVKQLDEDASGTTLDRPGLTQMRGLLNQGAAKAVIAHDSDRISRTASHYLMLRDEWTALGIELHYSQRGRIDLDSFGGQIVEDFYGRFAQEWRRKLLENCRAGKRTKVASGHVIVAKRPPYGYRLENETLVISEPEAEIVRLIYLLYTEQGYKLADIADLLTQRKVPTFADLHPDLSVKKRDFGYWSHTSVKQILTSESYCGVWHWGKNRRVVSVKDGKKVTRQVSTPRDQWLAVEIPAIVSRETWEKAQVLLVANKAQAARNTKHEYLMGKRLICGVCGLKIYASVKYIPTKAGKRKECFYYCASCHRDKFPGYECDLPYFSQYLVDSSTWWFVKKILTDPGFYLQLVNEASTKANPDPDQLASELKDIGNKINQKQRGLSKLLRAFADSEDENDKDIKATRDEINGEIEELKRYRADIEAKLDTIKERDQLLELGQRISQFQDSLLRDDEPFNVRVNWVKALKISAKLWLKGGHKMITFITHQGSFDMQIDDMSVWRYSHNLQLTYTIDLFDFIIKHPDVPKSV